MSVRDEPNPAARLPEPAADVIAFNHFNGCVDPLDSAEVERRSFDDGESTMKRDLADQPELHDQVLWQYRGFQVLQEAFADAGGIGAEPVVPAVTIPTDAVRIGRYSILGVIEQGGMGVVYRAARPGLDREVALKVVRPDLVSVPGYVERLRREAFLASRVSHQGVARILDVGQADEGWYYAMDLVTGDSLWKRITQLGSIDASEGLGEQHLRLLPWCGPGAEPADLSPHQRYLMRSVSFVARAADALAAAHAHQVLHRDLKPANIVITETGEPCLVDFGLSAHFDPTDRRLVPQGRGTVRYMPPEAFEDRAPASPAHDLWSLGVLLFELATLRVPFEGETAEAIMLAIRDGDLRPASSLNPAIDPELDGIIAQAMARSPRDRFGSAAEFVACLERFLARKTIELHGAKPLPLAQRWLRRAKRHRWKIAAIVFATLAIIEAIALLLG